MELKDIKYSVEDLVATITLSRASRRNAFTAPMNDEYRWCLAKADSDPAVRVIVVTGDPEGNAFCAGADLDGVEDIASTGEYKLKVDQELAGPGYGVNEAFDARSCCGRSGRRTINRGRLHCCSLHSILAV